jgi:hypothetical protein
MRDSQNRLIASGPTIGGAPWKIRIASSVYNAGKAAEISLAATDSAKNGVRAERIAAGDGSRQCGHGMIGTVLIALAGEPLTILVLIAR